MRVLIGTLIVILVLVGVGVGALYFYAQTISMSQQIDIDDADREADVRILFIGNSFTNYNDMHEMTAELLKQANPAWSDVLVARHAPDGRYLADHADEMNDISGDPRLRQALISGSETLRSWDYVILQEQSQIRGFGSNNESYLDSNRAAFDLASAASANGSEVVLLMTWGYREGDEMNPNAYADYLTMQDRITQGYDQLARDLSEGVAPTTVIPVGLGFRYVYFEIFQRGTEPLHPDLEFVGLYDNDGRHPSLAGSYMIACMTTAAITGQRVRPLSYVPEGLDAGYAAYIRSAVDAVVFDGALGARAYPYNSDN